MCAEAGLKHVITNPAAKSHAGIVKEFFTRRASLAPGAMRLHNIFTVLQKKHQQNNFIGIQKIKSTLTE